MSSKTRNVIVGLVMIGTGILFMYVGLSTNPEQDRQEVICNYAEFS